MDESFKTGFVASWRLVLVAHPHAFHEHHLTAGCGFSVSERLELSIAYMYALENNVMEQGTLFGGPPATIESALTEHTVDLGISWRF